MALYCTVVYAAYILRVSVSVCARPSSLVVETGAAVIKTREIRFFPVINWVRWCMSVYRNLKLKVEDLGCLHDYDLTACGLRCVRVWHVSIARRHSAKRLLDHS